MGPHRVISGAVQSLGVVRRQSLALRYNVSAKGNHSTVVVWFTLATMIETWSIVKYIV